MAIIRILAILAIAIPFPAYAFEWPGNAEAAVSITYDDGWDSQLLAVADLDQHDFKGTFYIWVGNKQVWDSYQAWRNAFIDGHEIGSHSVRHMCANRPADLTIMTDDDVRNDLSWASRWLNTYVGVDASRSYAYPCGEYALGLDDVDSYKREVSVFHPAARILGDGLNDPLTVDLQHISGKDFHSLPDILPMVSLVEEAAVQGKWLVVVFHEIGAGGFPISRSVHRAFLDYLADRNLWVAPVRTVARYITDHR